MQPRAARHGWILAVVAAGFAPLAPVAAAAALTADSAGDLCSAAADPCVVTEEVSIIDGSVLDFGTRTLSLQGAARLVFGAEGAVVLCGNLLVDVAADHAAIFSHAQDAASVWRSGKVEISARKRCSAGAQACLADSDCDAGTCSERDGIIDLDGEVRLVAEAPAGIVLRAAGNIALRRRVDTSSDFGTKIYLNTANGGGPVSVESRGGDVTILGPVVSDGIDAGNVVVEAARDLRVEALISVAGGYLHAGEIHLSAGADVVIESDTIAAGEIDGAQGGILEASAGRDVLVGGGSAVDRTLLSIDGADTGPPPVLGPGAGGTLRLSAARNIAIGPFVHLAANGGKPGADAGTIELTSGAATTIEGDFDARCGNHCVSGTAMVSARGNVTVADTSTIDVSDFVDSNSGTLVIASGAQLTVEGVLVNDGANGPEPFHSPPIGYNTFTACAVQVGPKGEIRHKGTSGDNIFEIRESLTVVPGGLVRSSHADNIVRVRTAEVPLVIDGDVIPAPRIEIDSELLPCRPCQVAADCDDAVACTTDTCSSSVCSSTPVDDLCDDAVECTIDSCGAQGCAHVASDDLCDDALPCTTDSCGPDGCEHDADDSLCSDDVACNGAETCTLALGCSAGQPVVCSGLDDQCAVGVCSEPGGACVAQPGNEGQTCDDADSCTGGDHCDNGQCVGEMLPACLVCGNGLVTAGEDCDDGDTLYVFGQPCAADCTFTRCGHPTGSSGELPIASDALFTLRAAVGSATCPARVCDTDANGQVSAGDALRVLKVAVGIALALLCPN